MDLKLIENIYNNYDAFVDLPELDDVDMNNTSINNDTADKEKLNNQNIINRLPSLSFVICLGKKSIIKPDDSYKLDLTNWHITRAFVTNLRPTILRELILDNNNIKRLPPLVSVELLQAKNASIYFLPEYAPNLKQLIVPNNSIVKLPYYEKLEFLDITDNWIKSINYRIKHIIAKNNPITCIIHGEYVDVTQCPVMCIPKLTQAKSSTMTNGKLTWKTKNKYIYDNNAEIYLNWQSKQILFFKPIIYNKLVNFL